MISDSPRDTLCPPPLSIGRASRAGDLRECGQESRRSGQIGIPILVTASERSRLDSSRKGCAPVTICYMTLRMRLFSRRRLVAAVAGVGAMGAVSAFATTFSLGPSNQVLSAGSQAVISCGTGAATVAWSTTYTGLSSSSSGFWGINKITLTGGEGSSPAVSCAGKHISLGYVKEGTPYTNTPILTGYSIVADAGTPPSTTVPYAIISGNDIEIDIPSGSEIPVTDVDALNLLLTD